MFSSEKKSGQLNDELIDLRVIYLFAAIFIGGDLGIWKSYLKTTSFIEAILFRLLDTVDVAQVLLKTDN